MVSSLQYKRRDPEGKRRGEGMYYHRGKGVWSKYDLDLDARRRSPITKKKNLPYKDVAYNQITRPHMGDYNQVPTKSKVIGDKTVKIPKKKDVKDRTVKNKDAKKSVKKSGMADFVPQMSRKRGYY